MEAVDDNYIVNMKSSNYGIGWANCPLDILMLVFEKLDAEDLMSCILVNKCWRDAVDYAGQWLQRQTLSKRLNNGSHGEYLINLRENPVYTQLQSAEKHRGIWKELAQTAMVNKGLTFRRRSKLGWRDLYINSLLWAHLRHAHLSWSYEVSEHDIRYLHVFKDTLIVESEEIFLKKYYHIRKELEDITDKLTSVNIESDEDIQPNMEEENKEDCSSRNSDRMIKKLVLEGPFKRLLVIDEDSFYLIDSKNVLRYFKWDDPYKRWLDYTLARYYGCNKSISDINVYNDEVYMLLKTGLVFRLDKAGRNFVPEHRFGLTQSRVIEMSRLIYPNVLKRMERVSNIDVPKYSTGRNVVLFQKLNAVVSVPMDKEFKMTVAHDTGSVVLEYPGLTSATQHGELICLGFKDGTVEICLPSSLQSGDPVDVRTNVKYCKDFKDKNPEIIALDVYEDKHSHHVFVATNCSVYRLILTYPGDVQDAIGFIKN